MSEKADWKLLRDKIKLPRDRWDRIENGVGVGMPDTNYCIAGYEGWMELKSPIEPKRDSTSLFGSNHPLSQDQKNWFKRQVLAGGRCYVLIGTNRRWMLIHGRHADEINGWTVAECLDHAQWYAQKPVHAMNDWVMLRMELMR